MIDEKFNIRNLKVFVVFHYMCLVGLPSYPFICLAILERRYICLLSYLKQRV